MVQVCLRGLAPKFGAFRIDLCTWENTPSFFDLQSRLLVEENHAGASTSMHTDRKMLYTEADRPRGRGGQGESVRNGGSRRDQGRRHRSGADSNSGPSENRGNRGDEDRQGKSAVKCWYCGKKRHRESAPIQREPVLDLVPDIPTREIGSDRTTPKDPRKLEKGLLS